MTIFVTVGNGKFDALVKEVDTLVSRREIAGEVIIQLGHGSYVPQHCTWFRFASPLTKYFADADMVISHGGPGSVFDVLRMGKKLLAVPNRQRTDPRHQVEFLRAISQKTTALLYCDHPAELAAALTRAKHHTFEQYVPPACTMHHVVGAFLEREHGGERNSLR